MPKLQAQETRIDAGPPADAAARPRVADLALGDQRRAAGRRDARAAHHLHGGGAHDAPRGGRQPARGPARPADHLRADSSSPCPPRTGGTARSSSTTKRSGSTCCRSGSGRPCDRASSKEVFLRGDGGVTLQQLIEVMDRLREGGVEKVGIVSKRRRRAVMPDGGLARVHEGCGLADAHRCAPPAGDGLAPDGGGRVRPPTRRCCVVPRPWCPGCWAPAESTSRGR